MVENLFIACPKCGTQVSKNFTHCKNCGAKVKKISIAKWVGYFFLAWIVLATIVSLSKNSDEKESSDTSNSSEKVIQKDNKIKNAEILNEIGQVSKEEKFEITLLKVQKRNYVGSEFFVSNPSSGGMYVVVSFRVKNISTKPINAFSMPSVSLIDSNGNKYDPDIGATASYATEDEGDAKILSDLNPGLSYTDHEVFEIANELFNENWKVRISKSTYKVQ